MASWNFRVLHDPDNDPAYRLIEVFYDANGAVEAWSETHPVGGDSLRELVGDVTSRTNAVRDAQHGDLRHAVLEQADLDRQFGN